MDQLDELDKSLMTGPTFTPGTCREHSEIWMNARDGSYFGLPKDPSARHDDPVPLSFEWIGPDMSWKGETHGHAWTRAIHRVIVSSATSYEATLQIHNEVSGGCGPDNTGGWGRAAPEYRTSFDVPVIPAGVIWTIRFAIDADWADLAGGLDGREVGPCTLRLTSPDGSTTDYNVPRRGKTDVEVKPAMTGLYGLRIFGSEVARGCLGAGAGVIVKGRAYIDINIQIFATRP